MFSIAVDLFFGLKVLNAAHVYCASGAFSTKVSAALSQKRDFSFFLEKEKFCSPQGIAKKKKKEKRFSFFFFFFAVLMGLPVSLCFFIFVCLFCCFFLGAVRKGVASAQRSGFSSLHKFPQAFLSLTVVDKTKRRNQTNNKSTDAQRRPRVFFYAAWGTQTTTATVLCEVCNRLI